MGSRLTNLIAEIVGVATSRQKQKQLLATPLYANAFYLMAANATSAVFTFVFWIIVARLYSAEDVGIASAAIAAAGLLAILSDLGLGIGLIRFLPGAGRKAVLMINTVFTVGTLTSVIVAIIFIAGLGFWSPALLVLRENPIYLATFVLFAVAATLWTLVEQAFVGKRRAGFVLAKNLALGLLRLPLPILLAVFFHSFGIFVSWSLSLGVALLLSIFVFLPKAQPHYRLAPAFDNASKEMLRFSFANYLSMLFLTAPGLILPIMVVNLLGAGPNAFFYIAWAIGGMLNMIASGPAFSLFAEGSHDEKAVRPNTWRALKITYLILVPAVILILAVADRLLLLFGGSYSENATTLLRILAISSLPLAIDVIYLNIKRVEQNLRVIVVLPMFVAVATLALSYVLLPRMGINGAGIAWLISQTTITLAIVASWLKGTGFRHKQR